MKADVIEMTITLGMFVCIRVCAHVACAPMPSIYVTLKTMSHACVYPTYIWYVSINLAISRRERRIWRAKYSLCACGWRNGQELAGNKWNGNVRTVSVSCALNKIKNNENRFDFIHHVKLFTPSHAPPPPIFIRLITANSIPLHNFALHDK